MLKLYNMKRIRILNTNPVKRPRNTQYALLNTNLDEAPTQYALLNTNLDEAPTQYAIRSTQY